LINLMSNSALRSLALLALKPKLHKMITVNSLSGGKTSSYMAVHCPADKNVFALVLIDDPKCSPKDKGLIQKVSDKLGRDFIATAEDDLTLFAMFDLEQLLGKSIDWVHGKTFDRTVEKRMWLPNQMARYCTVEMKLRPIKNYCKQFGHVEMNIGFRYDEKERGENFQKEQTWRNVKFPLIENKIGHYTVYKWVQTTGLIFPPDSNCVGCFHKPLMQLRKNWETNPEKMEWFASKEIRKRKWKSDVRYEQIKTIGLQSDFNFGTGAGCQAGFCTD
jgi:3'-phosphoadenosine 5'-phosphosulfate sulfotransferase (PAPS reductase)/FAD synthetase